MTTTSNWTRRLRKASVPLILASLAACASPSFRSDVTRFSAQLPAPQGQSFAIVADDPALAGGLEFSQYAGYVAQEMRDLGYTQAASAQSADLLVRFDYGITGGRERVRSSPGFRDPFFAPWYGYGGFGGRRFFGPWGYGFYDPFFAGGGFGGGPQVSSYTIYTSDIDLKIDRAGSGERLFEGRAEAISSSNRLPYLVPNLVDAMFTNFPGNSGETVRISIAPEDQRVQRRDR